MAQKHTHHRPPLAFRHRSQIPLPAVDDVAPRRLEGRSPSWLAPRQLERRDPWQPQRLIRRRQRLLTRPVRVALLVSLVWRRVPSIAEGQKVLTRAGWLGMVPLPVSPPAITTRLEVLPATVLGPLLTAVCTCLQAQPPPPLPHPRWAPVREPVPRLAMGDGSPLAARRHTTPILRQREGLVVAGTGMVMGAAFSHRPRGPLDTAEAPAHDQRLAAEILAARPGGGLLGWDVGVFSVPSFDALTAPQQGLVTRMRAKTADRTVQGLSASPDERDEIIQVGPSRSNPCRPPRRLMAARWPGAWSRDRTHVREAPLVSARQVCERYRRRWRLEDACALTTRLWEVASGWTGSTPAVPWQIDATRMCDAVLGTIGPPVAQALGEPLERLSVERVWRAFDHQSRAVQHGERDHLVACLADHATRLGIVKRQRQSHRERQHLESLMWGDPEVETDAPMLATERPTDGAAERQAIVRNTEQLQALVTAMQAGKPVDFRAIHDVASRITQAAYEGWKKAALAQIAPRTTPH